MRPKTVGSRCGRPLGALGLVVAGAVLAGGVVAFGGSLFPEVGASGTPFTFDAPAVTVQRYQPDPAPERAAAGGDALVLGDWQFTEFPLNSAEAVFLTTVFFVNPDDFVSMLFMVYFPGFAETLRSISGGNTVVEFVLLVTVGTFLLGGENPVQREPPPPTPISPTT